MDYNSIEKSVKYQLHIPQISFFCMDFRATIRATIIDF